jgi:hypothetical protein
MKTMGYQKSIIWHRVCIYTQYLKIYLPHQEDKNMSVDLLGQFNIQNLKLKISLEALY